MRIRFFPDSRASGFSGRLILTALASFTFTGFATSQELPVPPEPEDVKAGAVATVDAAAKTAAAPLDPRRKALHDRVRALHAKQADYMKKIASGEVEPFPEIRERWPQIQEDTRSVLGQVDVLNAMGADNPGRPTAEEKLLAQLQVVGEFFQGADHPPREVPRLTPEQVAEFDEIEAGIDGAARSGERGSEPLALQGPGEVYTLIHLPVPLAVKSVPRSEVFLEAETGGQFPNGLPVIRLVAGDDGIAKTFWVSRGGAVGRCEIVVTSAAAPEEQAFIIQVVTPVLVPPPGSPIPDPAEWEAPKVIIPHPYLPERMLPKTSPNP